MTYRQECAVAINRSLHGQTLLLFVIWMSVAIVMLSMATPVSGQDESGPPTIDAKIQLEIIDSVCTAMNEVYVFPEVAKQMEKLLRKNHKDGAYKDLTNTADFARKLTEDLQSISHDGHLHTDFVSDRYLSQFVVGDLTDEERQQRRDEALARRRANNFGFVKAEHMTGNVGYLKFDNFADTYDAGGTAIAALNFLGYCDALIIDLRDNGGGQPSMVQLITSYFFDESKHLNSFYIRQQDTIQQFWTQEYVEGPRMSHVDLYILTSSYTFSAAEEFIYNLKNMERATIIGETTAGGAHPNLQRVFPNFNIAMSLPYGRAINPITRTNWEGTGIEPDIAVPRDEALAVAHREALEKLAEKATDEEKKAELLWYSGTMDALANPATVDPATLQKYAGVYGPRTITFEDGILYYQREGRPKFKMVPMADDLFCFEGLEYFHLKVNVDDSGNPTELVGMYVGGRTDVSPRNPGQ